MQEDHSHDYQDVLDRPSTESVRQQCAKLVSHFRKCLNCRRDVYENMTLRHPAAMDACRCYPPCSDVTYDSSYSLSTLPPHTSEHAAFYSPLLRFLVSLSPERKQLLGVKDNLEKTVFTQDLMRVVHRIRSPESTLKRKLHFLFRFVVDLLYNISVWIGV